MLDLSGVSLEIDAGGGGGGAPEPVAAEPVAPVAPAEPVAPVEPVAPAAPAFDYDDPRLNDLIQTQASQIAEQRLQELVQRAQAQQGQQPGQGVDPSQLVDEYGQVNPAALAQLVEQSNARTLAAVQQMFTPLASQMQAAQEAEVVASGEARLEDILADDISRNGDFVRAAGNTPEQIAQAQAADAQARQLVRTTADQLFPEIAQRYGATPRAAEIAMTRAADQVRTLLRAAGVSATAAQANQLATLAGQHGEPGTPGVTGVSRPVVKIGERVVDRYAAAGPPVQ